MSYREPGKVLRDILINELELDPGQVMFTNQKYDIPTTGLFIVISYVGPSKVISRRSELVAVAGAGMAEVKSIAMLHQLQIDMMAYNDPEGGNQARARKEEIPMALSSIFAQQQQEHNTMQFSRHTGDMIDTSFLEETEMMTRYTMTLGAIASRSIQKTTTEYYDTFPGAAVFPDPTMPVVPILAPPVNEPV